MIPMLDMRAQLDAIRGELDAAWAAVLDHGRFVSGPEVREFETAWARYCAVEHAVGISSGTDALTLALQALGVGRGDEVITTAMTFIATVESIVQLGAVPVLVDPDPDTALLTADAVEAAITGRTVAIVPVHLYGQTVDLDAFRALADRRGVALVEDAAQAHGAEWNGRRAGSVGDAAAFSFFPGKNLGALGDAGGITTRDRALGARIAKLRDHGRVDKYRHDELGTNARLDTLQAAVLSVKLRHLESWNEGRRRVAAVYDAAFAGVEGVDPLRRAPAATHVYHQYVVRVEDRDGALESLRRAGVAAGVHYPLALHQQPALAGVVADSGFEHAERLAAHVLSLPIYPELSMSQQERVIEAVSAHAATLVPERAG